MENKGNTLSVMLDPKYLVLGGAPPSTWVPQAQVVETQAQDSSLLVMISGATYCGVPGG